MAPVYGMRGLRRVLEESGDDAGGAVPARCFARKLLSTSPGDRVILRAAVVLRRPPLGRNPPFLLESQQRGIQGALVQTERVAADLFDAPRDAPAVQRPHGIERFQDHQCQRAVENVDLVGRHEDAFAAAIGPAYSYRNAVIGSTRDARRAGTYAAVAADTTSTRVASPSVAGSPAVNPYNRPDTTRAAASASGRPTAIPAASITSVCRRINHRTDLAVAPSAIRIPISPVRCATVYAITP